MINISLLAMEPLAANCLIVTDAETGKTAVIDPGSFDERLDRKLSEVGYDNIEYVLLTHGHYDHTGGANDVIKKTDNMAKVAIYKTEEEFLSDSYLNLSLPFTGRAWPVIKADVLLSDGDKIELGSSVITVMHTPGHTKGSVCYICDDNIFSGDTLFCESAGRTDFPTSDEHEMYESLHKLAALEGDYTVYPGHNMKTTLNNERKYNPFM